MRLWWDAGVVQADDANLSQSTGDRELATPTTPRDHIFFPGGTALSPSHTDINLNTNINTNINTNTNMYRSSTGALDRFDDQPPRAGQRWDRDRFEREQRGAGGSQRGGSIRDEHEHYRFQEHDRFPGGRRDIDIHQDRDRRGPRVLERERVFQDERFDRPARRRNEIFDEKTPSEIANLALAPYRRSSVIDRDIDISKNIDMDAPSRRRPARPQYIRRQSSLDTFDRRPLPRYGDIEKEEYRPPANVPIPLPVRERRSSPPRRFRDEDEYEDYRFAERAERGRDREADYREVEIHREKSRVRRSKSVAKSTRSSSVSSFEEAQPSRANWGKKGRTRLPKRLVKREAVIELGYPFEEEVCMHHDFERGLF